MSSLFASRMSRVHRSFLTEILKVTETPEVISFAGGLPNPQLFPVREVADAAAKVLEEDGRRVLQYTTSQGYLPLREFIAERYWKRHRLQVDPAEILITSGSQQGIDLISKVFLDAGDRVVLESPAYHGAIQAFVLYEPTVVAVPLLEDGIDIRGLDGVLRGQGARLFYTVPNFQNPSGLTYSAERRARVADTLASHGVLLVEDDPYGELRFEGEDLLPIKSYLKDEAVLLGTFSKIVAPGFRLGWTWARREVTEQLLQAKQAADFHTDHFSQRVVHRYLADNDVDEHVFALRATYRKQRDLMLSMIERYIPKEVRYTRPEGGMFVYMTLPEGVSALRLFDLAARENVVFVPGKAFHLDEGGENSLRLSYSTAGEEIMEEGMKRLASAIRRLLAERS